MHAAAHKLAGPKSMPVHANSAASPYNEQFVLRDKKGLPVANFPYRLAMGNGRVVSGVTDSQGRTPRVGSGNEPSAIGMEHPSQH